MGRREQKAMPARKVMQVPKGLRAFRANKDHLGLPGKLEQLVRRASKARLGRRVMWGPPAPQGRLGSPVRPV